MSGQPVSYEACVCEGFCIYYDLWVINTAPRSAGFEIIARGAPALAGFGHGRKRASIRNLIIPEYLELQQVSRIVLFCLFVRNGPYTTSFRGIVRCFFILGPERVVCAGALVHGRRVILPFGAGLTVALLYTRLTDQCLVYYDSQLPTDFGMSSHVPRSLCPTSEQCQ